MRTQYEDEKDRLNERIMRDKIEFVTGWSLGKAPKWYHWDWIGFNDDDKVIGVFEGKDRSKGENPLFINSFPTYMISLMKIQAGLTSSKWLKVPFFLWIQFTDHLAWVEVKWDHLKDIRIQKKDWRGDTDDIEPCVFIPINDFVVVTYEAKGV
jgi:hypothetical protein